MNTKIWNLTGAGRLVLGISLLSLCLPARATLRVWSGNGADNFWNTGANWTNTSPPVAGDDLLFPAVTLRLSNSNNITAATTFNTLTFSGSNYVINGNALTLSAGLTNNAPAGMTNTFNCATTLGANQAFGCPVNATLNLGSDINTGGKIITLAVGGQITSSGVISSSGALAKTGAGSLVLAGTNTYFGSTTISAGTVTILNSSALGTSTGSTLVSSGATLSLQNNLTMTKPLILSGTLDNAAGNNTVSGNISLGFNNSTVNAASGTSLVLSNALTGAGGLFKTGLGTLTLSGSSNNTYADATVVLDGTLILSKTAGTNAIPGNLVIGDSSGTDTVKLLASDQIADSAIITFNPAGVLSLNGNNETVGPLLMDGGMIDTSTGTLTLSADVVRVASTVAGASSILGKLSLGGSDRTITVNTNPSVQPMFISAVISDGGASAGFTKAGPAVLGISGTNTYTGLTIIAEGTLNASSPGALGATGGGTVISNGAVLRATSTPTLDEASLTLFGTISSLTGITNTLPGTINLASSTASALISGNLTFSGALTGTGGLSKNGFGVLQLSGTNANTYADATTVNLGTLVLNKSPGTNAVPGALVINGFGTNRLLAADQIADTSAVAVDTAGLFDLNSHSETIGSLSGAGSVTLGEATLTTGGDNTSTTFSGIMSGGGGGLTKVGTGTQTLSGNNTYTGTTRINSGTLLINGSQNSPVTLAGGTLGGSGTCSSINGASGQVSPGASPGILNVTGNVSLTNLATTYVVELNGTTAGIGYDQLNVTGGINLTNCLLSVSLGYTPAPGDSFTIIANDGADPVAGIFNALPEGSFYGANGQVFRISYVGGSGNDVVLTTLPLATGIPRFWTGLGADNFWTTAANWSNNVAPSYGDDLVFDGTVRKSNSNDFSSGTRFNSVTLPGPGYALDGNQLNLNAGISNGAAGNLINCAIFLNSNQTFSCSGGLTLAGQINTSDKALTFDCGSLVIVNSRIFGIGSLQKTGANVLNLLGTNNYTGATTVSAGRLIVQNGSALGDPATGTTVAAGASLELEGGFSIPEPITLQGTLRNFTGTNTVTGDITLSLATSTIQVDTNTSLTLSNALTGAGGLIKLGPGPLTLAGTNANTYAAASVVNEGTLLLSKPSGTNAIPGVLAIGDGTGGANADVVRLLANNQIADGTSVSIGSSGLLDLNSHAETIGPLSLTNANVQTGLALLTLGGDVTSTNSCTMSGSVSLGSGTRTFTDLGGGGFPDFVISAAVSGSADFIKSGVGAIGLSNSNSYSGLTTINDGTLRINSPFSLGSTNAGTTINNNGSLSISFSSPGAIGLEALTLNSSNSSVVFNVLGSNSWAGAVALAADASLGVNPGATLVLGGAVSGSGKLTSSSGGTLMFAGTNANTYSGGTVVSAGTLSLNKSPGVNAIPGSLTVGDGTGGANADVVRLGAADQIAGASAVTVASSGLLDLNNNSDSVGSLAGSGNVTLGTGTLGVGSDNTSTSFSGLISGTGGLTKLGTGTQTLTANNTYSGTTLINSGALLINGSQPASPVTLAGGTLGGSGTCGAITASSGQVSPGASTAVLNASGNVALTNPASFIVELNGTTPGSGYDQLNVTGTVNLANCPLTVSLGFAPAISNTFTLIANDGVEPITGTFAGLPQGATLTVLNTAFVISYTGGSGNDVVLTVPPLASGVPRFWTGAGADNFWTTPANWSNNVPPSFGDDLVFPATAARASNSNDFSAFTRFNSITYSNLTWVANGNVIALNAGLTNFGVTTFNCPLILASNQTVSCRGAAAALGLGPVDNAGNTLTLDATATINAVGVLSGAGAIQKIGAGVLGLDATNTYLGTTTINAGSVFVKQASALGATSAGTTVGVGTVLALENGISLAEPITLFGTLENFDNTNTVTGSITLFAANATFQVDTNTVLTCNGVLTGSGRLNKTGPGPLTLAGSSANTYSGSTFVNEGTLNLNKSPGVTAVSGTALFIGDGLGGVNVDLVQLLASDQIADSTAITVNSSGFLALNLFNETIGPLTMDGGLVDSGSGTLTLNGDVTRAASAVAAASTIGGKLSFGGADRSFVVNTNPSPVAMTITASISDGASSAGLTKTGAGILNLASSNSFTGPVIVSVGTLIPNNPNALGATGGGTVVSNGAVLQIGGSFTLNESSITLFGTLKDLSGTNAIGGTVTIAGSGAVIDVNPSTQLSLSGVLAGAGAYSKTSGGILQLSDSSANTFTGTTTVSQGTLLLNKSASATAIAGPLVISGTARLLADDQIDDSAALTVNSGGVFDMNNRIDVIGSLAGSAGASVTLGTSALITGGNNSSTTFAGIISGSGSLQKLGTGTMILAGNNTYPGPTFISGGALLVNGSQPASPIRLDGGTLGGAGTVGTILGLSGGAISPGNSPGILSCSNVTINLHHSYNVELNGTTPGSGYDQLNVSGTVSLTGATLTGTVGFSPAISNTFTIINNDGVDPITTVFNNLAEGAIFAFGGLPFAITYHGGDGNDVVLTRLRPASFIGTFALTNGTNFAITGTGIPGVQYVLEASTNFINWSSIATNAADPGQVYHFIDTDAHLFPARFYRVLTP